MLPMNILEDFRPKLEQFNKITEPEMNAIISGSKHKSSKQELSEITDLKNQLNKIIEVIAKTGEMNQYDWKLIKNVVILRIRDILTTMQASFPDCKSVAGESFDEQMEVILQFMCGFEEKPPFTIQRICELILNPKKYYKSSKKLLFAFEKLVNVSQI